MGTRSTKICDVCKGDLPFDGMFPVFRVGKVSIQLSKKGWDSYEVLAHFEGELCTNCVTVILRAAEMFHRELEKHLVAVSPGEKLSDGAVATSPKTLAKRRKRRAR